MMLRIHHAWLDLRHHLYYRLQAAVTRDAQGAGESVFGIGRSVLQPRTQEFRNTRHVTFPKQRCDESSRGRVGNVVLLNSTENDHGQHPQSRISVRHEWVGPVPRYLRMTSPRHQWVGPAPRFQRMTSHSYKRTCLSSILSSRCRSFCSCSTGGNDGSDDCSDHEKDDGNDSEPAFPIRMGDWDQLLQKIESEKGFMNRKVLNFEDRYNRLVKPKLSSGCLIAPHDLKHPSTVFLHRQTVKILNRNPSYLSCFDVMSYEGSVRDEKTLDFFMQYIIDKRIYIIEDWDSSFATVETLMYDHGLVEPEEESEHEFRKGEFDASYDNGRASLSFIIWKGDKIVYSEVYKDVKCDSATEAEAYAAFALLTKAVEM